MILPLKNIWVRLPYYDTLQCSGDAEQEIWWSVMPSPAVFTMHAELTPGWRLRPSDALDAVTLRPGPQEQNEAYDERVAAVLDRQRGAVRIANLDGLIRRTPDGFDAVKRLVAAVLRWGEAHADRKPEVVCSINAFTYAFLKGAKNFDLIMPQRRAMDTRSGFGAVLDRWQRAVTDLEDFERAGKPLPKEPVDLRPVYLALRSALMRKSARDERRVLTLLMLVGPSTLQEIASELGLSHDLARRTLTPYLNAGLVETVPDEEPRYCVAETYLPVALFGLREAVGLDLVRALA